MKMVRRYSGDMTCPTCSAPVPSDAPTRPFCSKRCRLVDLDRRRAVLDAMATLPQRQREVIALRHYAELSEAEIADTLGISRGAVKSHASRGSAALRERLSDLWEERP